MLYFYVIVAILMRLLPHPWNITPVAALFLFSGATFQHKWQSLALPFAALIVSDYAVIQLLYGGHYSWFMPYNWTGFLLIGLIGWVLRHRISTRNVVIGSLTGSIVFFLVSNFGVWAEGTAYPMSNSGLLTCYIAGLPFFRNTLFGDLAYAAIMFGSYHFIQKRQATAIVQV